MSDPTVRAANQAELSRKLAQVRRTYLKRLGATLVSIRRMEALLEGGFCPPSDLQLFYRLSHDYAGSGATFGFPEISVNARNLHHELKDFLAGDQDATQPRFRVLEKIRTFETACRAAIDAPAITETSDFHQSQPADPAAKAIGILAGPGADAASLEIQLAQYGYRIETASGKPAQWQAGMPDIIIACGAGALDAHPAAGHTTPAIVVGGEETFDARLAAIRAGAAAYFTGPPDLLKVIEKIETLLIGTGEAIAYSILIVDDDPMLSALYEHSLRQAGMKTTAVTSAKECLAAMEAQAFDLVLMDYAMPHCDGRELATMIRQQDEFVSLPIVFMSAKPDIEGLLIDRGLGIDAYLVKPFLTEQLVSIVRSRARRAAELRALMVRDSFTGLLNHASFIEALTTEHHALRRTGRSVVYATIDIDKFKSVNDTFGHAAGDTVIKSLSRLLKYQLRRSDVIGRCGGEEFGIMMPDCDLDNAQRIIGNLLIKFRELIFDFDGAERTITFSGGIVLLKHDQGLDVLLAAADKALYQAKENGRNQLMLAAAI